VESVKWEAIEIKATIAARHDPTISPTSNFKKIQATIILTHGVTAPFE
jgi:hypothetical protein